MRHKKAGRKLNRTMEHRKALFRNMTRSLLVHERIRTTLPKAKELRKFVEPLISLALTNDLSARREAYKFLGSHQLVQKLFDEIGPRFAGQATGGYTRIVRFSQPRIGDSAPMALIELTVMAEPVQEDVSAENPREKDAVESAEEKPADEHPEETEKKEPDAEG